MNLSGSSAASIHYGLGEDSEIDALLQGALLRYGVSRIEDTLKGSIGPDAFFGAGTHDWTITSDDIDALTALMSEKICEYQLKDGRDLLCSAAALNDETRVGSVGRRSIAPTSRSLCRACNLPHTDNICSHLIHPDVHGLIGDGQILKRQAGATCDLGRQEVNKVAGCRAGGHDCWQYMIEISPVVKAPSDPPMSLPEALDFLNAEWRLAFGKTRRSFVFRPRPRLLA